MQLCLEAHLFLTVLMGEVHGPVPVILRKRLIAMLRHIFCDAFLGVSAEHKSDSVQENQQYRNIKCMQAS